MPGASRSEDAKQLRRREIGGRIRAGLRERRMTMKQLGEAVPTSTGTPTSQAQVSKWVNGVNEPEPAKWQAIADALHRDIEEIFGLEGSNTDGVSRLDEVEDRLNALIRIQGLEEAVDQAVRADRSNRRRHDATKSASEAKDEDRGPGRPRAVPTPPGEDAEPEEISPRETAHRGRRKGRRAGRAASS